MKKVRDYIDFKLVGECDVDIDGIVKSFSLLNRIFEHGNQFTLLEYTPKGKRKLKVSIKAEDAKTIIKKLHLYPCHNPIFANAIMYVPTM